MTKQEEQLSRPSGKTYEFVTDIPKLRWQIKDVDKANEAKVRITELGNEVSFLEINVQDIPKRWTIVEWIDILLENGIIFKDTVDGGNNKDKCISDSDNQGTA
jgi:hypothetical protein